MEEEEFFTKGNIDEVLKRIHQVHTITIYCPINDLGIQILLDTFIGNINQFSESALVWKQVPAIEALGCFLQAKDRANEFNIDTTAIGIISASLGAFKRLKYINFEFTIDALVEDTFNKISMNDTNITKNIYRVDVMELNLSDMFSQYVIDNFNKVLMINEIIPNSIFEKVFKIEFSYDEYISFMDMFLGNYGHMLNQLDDKICDYFRTFPSMIEENKPVIMVITNYSNL